MCVIRQTQQILKHSNESIIPKQSYSPNVVRKENLGPVPIKRLSRLLSQTTTNNISEVYFRGNQGITRHRLFFVSSSFFMRLHRIYPSLQQFPNNEFLHKVVSLDYHP